ncbi:MAG: hypothetical protein LCH41_01025 [Armatimonadetes bacterium]|nr:hypothetical protein [Armatimonadota bacterium]
MPSIAVAYLIAAAGSAGSVEGPRLLPEGRVRFELSAPMAQGVSLRLDSLGIVPMIRDEAGSWQLEVGPLMPDIYTYTFIVDRKVVGDERNPLRKPAHDGGYESILVVPSTTDVPWQSPTRGLGDLYVTRFHSSLYQETREALVYLPRTVSKSHRAKLPMLILLHGVREDQYAWSTAGRAPQILQNLMDEGKAQPMVIVMPLGYGFSDSHRRVGELFSMSPRRQKETMDSLAEHILEELVPHVESHFPVSQTRAIAGLSMGGAQALYLGMKHPRQFSHVGSFGGAFMMYGADSSLWFGDNSEREVPEIMIRCGESDFVMTANNVVRKWLDERGIAHVSSNTPGGHEWRVWNRDLANFLPTLFRTERRSASLKQRGATPALRLSRTD